MSDYAPHLPPQFYRRRRGLLRRVFEAPLNAAVWAVAKALRPWG